MQNAEEDVPGSASWLPRHRALFALGRPRHSTVVVRSAGPSLAMFGSSLAANASVDASAAHAYAVRHEWSIEVLGVEDLPYGPA